MLILRVGSGAVGYTSNDRETFRQYGVNLEPAVSGYEALDLMRLYEYDLILMDLKLSDLRGDEVVRQARLAGVATPVVILSDETDLGIRIRALDQGADDFVTTPCDTDELLARVRAIVRRGRGHAQSILRAGCVELSLERREVRVQGRTMPITRREFGVLELLFLKQGTVLNKTAFLDRLYTRTEEPELKAVDVIICRLRKKLARFGVGDMIDTVRGSGYRLRPPAAPAETEPMKMVA